jgi:hypothetical protein
MLWCYAFKRGKCVCAQNFEKTEDVKEILGAMEIGEISKQNGYFDICECGE